MKAKECAEIYTNSDNKNDAIAQIGAMFVSDTIEIIKDRKLNTATALQSVLREQSNKWKAFCRQVGGEISEQGFQIIVKHELPKLLPYF